MHGKIEYKLLDILMRAITSIGEIGVTDGEREYLFRPSLAAMDSLGSPSEIVEIFVALQEPLTVNPFWPMESYRAWIRDVTSTAYDVLVACCDEDITPLVGHMGSRWGTFVMGSIPASHMILLARSLMHNGIIGIQPKGRPSKPQEEYTNEFNAREFVSQAMAHLRYSSDDAWRLTMTEFTGAMQSKFGKPDAEPDLDEHNDSMARLKAINALRDKRPAK